MLYGQFYKYMIIYVRTLIVVRCSKKLFFELHLLPQILQNFKSSKVLTRVALQGHPAFFGISPGPRDRAGWGVLKMWDPQVTMGFNTKMIYSKLGWFGGTTILGNLHFYSL